jgi:hypothetical protein
MKVTIVQLDDMEDVLLEGEALMAKWDNEKGEFVIRGDRDNQGFTGVVASVVERRKVLVEIEDTGPGRLVWRGYVGSAKFLSFDSEEVECCLIMLLDDWFGIVPQFSSS